MIVERKMSQMRDWTKAVQDKYVNDAARKTGMKTYLPEGVTPDQAASLVGQLVNEQIMVAATHQKKGIGFDTARKFMQDKIAKLKTSNPKLFEQYTEEQLNIIQTEIVNAWVAVKGTGLPPLTEAEKEAMKTQMMEKVKQIRAQVGANKPSLSQGALENSLPGFSNINETMGRNQMLILVFFVASVLYILKRLLFRKKQDQLKDKLIEDYFEEAL